MRGDGNGWVISSAGQRFWGRYGAAGLLLWAPRPDDTPAVLLQHREIADLRLHPGFAASWPALRTLRLPGMFSPIGLVGARERGTPRQSVARMRRARAAAPISSLHMCA
jgi:hypothetical protein